MGGRVSLKRQAAVYEEALALFESPVLAHYAMCIRVIDEIAGRDWIPTVLGRLADAHLAWDVGGPSRVAQYRLGALARGLFLLQRREGFDDMVAKLRTRSLLGASAEIHFATLLQHNRLPTTFVTPSGIKGEDYDLRAAVGPHELAVEVKAKDAATRPSEKTIRYTLSAARSQLPHGRPGMIVLAIPTDWTRETATAPMLGDEVDRLFRTSGRVNGVVVWWDELLDQMGGPGFAATTRYRLYENDEPRVSLIRPLADLLGNLPVIERYSTAHPWGPPFAP